MSKDERNKIREIFKDSIIDVINDYDPSGIITGTIHKDTGMGFTIYLQSKTNLFIGGLRDEGLI